jgi:nucleoside-diphosphate-sugar epimerase
MTALLIGAGLVGSQVARILSERGERPLIMDRAPNRDALAATFPLVAADIVEGDVLDLDGLTALLRARGITAIAHTAAHPGLTGGAEKEPYPAIRLNIMGTANVLEAARLTGVKRVVVASSSVLNNYMAGGDGDTQEESWPRPTTVYGVTKQAVENLAINYARLAGIETAALRYGPVAGPWLGDGGGRPTQMFRAVVEAALKGEPVPIPETAMEWVYSKDAAAATVAALSAPDLGTRVFNVTMGRVYGPADLAAAVKEVFPGADVRLPSSSSEAERQPASIALAAKLLGYTPRYQAADALRDYADWWRAHC